MASLNDEAFQRSNLALSNQMEMLTFFLSDEQLYAINVFKIIETIEAPKKITRIPSSHPAVKGTMGFRDRSIMVVDLSQALAMTPIDYKNKTCYIIVCEYNTLITGFLISHPNTLMTRSWEDIKRPSGLLTNTAALTAIAYDDNGNAIQLLDVEKILSEVLGEELSLPDDFKINADVEPAKHTIMTVDDSKTASMHISQVLSIFGYKILSFDAAQSALNHIAAHQSTDPVSLIICDIEMPGMDGFTFTRTLREMKEGAKIKVLLHSSLSNPTNMEKAKQVGADDFLAKFQPEELVNRVSSMIQATTEKQN